MAEEESQAVVNEDAVVETAATESTTEETNSPDVAEETPSVQSDDGELHQPESPTESESDDEEQSEDAEDSEEEKPQTRAEKRKEQLQSEIDELSKQADPNTEIRDLVAKRNELKQRVEAKNAEVYQAATVDELLEQVNPETGDYYSRLEAKLEAREQADRVREYNEQIVNTQLTLQSEAERALREFPMFDSQSPEFNEEVAAQADQIMSAALQFDQQTGQIIGTSVSPYQLYKSLAVAAQSSARAAQIKGQKATEKMLSQADRVTGGQGKDKSYDKMSLSEKEAYLRRKGHDV